MDISSAGTLAARAIGAALVGSDDGMGEGFELGKDDGLSDGLWERFDVGFNDGE